MDPGQDQVVAALCRSPGYWGLDALVRSHWGYKTGLVDAEASRFRAFGDGNPFLVEQLTLELMRGGGDPGAARANLMFLFALVPLRAPAKSGLAGPQALQVVTRIMMATFDCYAASKDDELKAVWMDAFVDAALFLIHDDGLLSGMVMDAPPAPIIEALASTEFMMTVLHYKFVSGPVLFFCVEFLLFMGLMAVTIWQVTRPVPELNVVLMGAILTSYFTVREIVQM